MILLVTKTIHFDAADEFGRLAVLLQIQVIP